MDQTGHSPQQMITAQQNEQAFLCRNLLRETKHQRDLLKDCFCHLGALAGQEDMI